MRRHLALCVCGSLKRSLCLGRYFSRYVSCLLLMAPRRFLRRQDGSGSGGAQAGPPAPPQGARGPRVRWGRAGGSSRPPEPFPPPGLCLSGPHCLGHPSWSPAVTPAGLRCPWLPPPPGWLPDLPAPAVPTLPRPPRLPGAPHAEAAGKAWAYMLSGGEGRGGGLRRQVGGHPGLPAKHSWRSPVPTCPRPRRGRGLALANEM